MTTRRRTYRLALALLGAACALQAANSSQLADLTREYLKSPTAQNREALARVVTTVKGDAAASAHLALGVGDHYGERFDEAVIELKAAESAPLADYARFFRGRSFALAEKHAEAAWVLKGFSQEFPNSRLREQASQIRAESLIRANELGEARKLLEDRSTVIHEAVRYYLLGRVLELSGDPLEAVSAYRRAYYFHPKTDAANDSERQLNGLNRSLGPRYPDAPADWRLARADALFRAGDYAEASAEYGRAWTGLKGKEQERAKVRYGAANYKRVHTSTAMSWLASLKVSDPELDAERIYYLGECARRKDQVREFQRRADELKAKYPTSPWREELLLSLGNFYLLKNDGRWSRFYYEQAARAFPKGKYAELTHWKVAWRAYLDRDPRARALMEEHVRLYPGSGQASAALYWVARLDEKAGESADAKLLYQQIIAEFPNYYYTTLAEERLARLASVPTPASAQPQARFSAPRHIVDSPSDTTRRILNRGRLLFDVGLDELAERELASADYRAADSHLIGVELARQLWSRDDYFQAMRYLKRYGYGYLRMDFNSMPREFWEGLYPMPWEDRLRVRAEPHDLDPYLVAGLIRQESEFNPSAVSRAGAIGLMQVMPATGKGIARQLGISGFSAQRLREPDVSLRLGTFHLKGVLGEFEGELELALAAYNAGGHRAKEWITWADFEEPAEFVETIPFTETRGYVQSVLRNREMYRKLYGEPGRARDRAAGGDE